MNFSMKKKVAIVFGITSNYTFALANVLIGMKKHCKPCWDDIIVYHDGINEEEQKAINSILPCKFVLFDESMFNDEAIHSEALKSYSLLTLARFECFGLLEEYHKVVWHDVDILVQKDFSALLNYGDVSGYAATQSPIFRMEQNFYGIMPGYNMLSLLYNAGILVLSDMLPTPSELRIYCYNTFNQHAPKLRYNDQSVLNMMIQDYKIDVEIIDLDMYCCHPDTPTYKDAAIIHAYGNGKFWNSDRLERQFPEWHENNREWLNIRTALLSKRENTAPTVSVLMSIYERTDYIQEAVRSILNQTFSDFEFIIVVEHSPFKEQICNELKKFNDERIVVVSNKTKLGFSASLNVGLEIARGKYIARMDDDDISMPDRFEKQVRFLDTHPDITMVGSWIQIFGREHKEEHRPESHEELMVWAIKENPMFHPTVMIRKADIDLHGFIYDPEWLTEDYDLWMRMMEKCKFANIPEVLHHFRASSQNATVTKAQRVLECHLDIMRRTLRTNLGLEFSRDEMLLLRTPSVIHECFNSDDMENLRKDTIQRIYRANDEKKVYNDELLQKYLGVVKLDLKTDTKLRLKKYPWLYEKVRAVYRWLFKKDDQIPKTPSEHSLLARIKMRLLPPSSRSFHVRMAQLEEKIDGQGVIIRQQMDKSYMQEQRIIWVDELIRRLMMENSAGFWGLYHTNANQSGITRPGLEDEAMRVHLFKEYTSAIHVLRLLNKWLNLSAITGNPEKQENAWTIAAETLGIQVLEDVHAKDNGLVISVSNVLYGEDNFDERIHRCASLCSKGDLVLFATKPENKKTGAQEIEDNLKCWKQEFDLNGYCYYDLRPYINQDWEIIQEHKYSMCLFIKEDLFDEITDRMKTMQSLSE